MDETEIQLADRRLHARWFGETGPRDPYVPTLVFLHEGLGSTRLWRTFPAALCHRVGLRGLAYDRTGYGRSSAWPAPPGPRYMDIEGDEILPQLLDAAGIGTCVLVGHSDGGTIALDYASRQPPLLRAVVTIGAHVVSEPRTVSSIRHARDAFVDGGLRARLRKYHGDNVDGAFRLWSDAWLSPGFEPMDAAARLPRVRVPVLALQGEGDEYGTEVQLRAIARGVSGRCETHVMKGCGHGPHLQDEARMVEVIAAFVTSLSRGPRSAARRGAGALLVALGLALGPSAAAGQSSAGCAEPAAAALRQAGAHLEQLDDDAAVAALESARSRPGTCAELGLASLAVAGWVEARRLARTGGAPADLGPVHGILASLEHLRSAGPPTAIAVQHAVYADAVIRAAVAAAQDERDEMQIYLTHAAAVADSLALAGTGARWPLPLDEVEGELWFEVDRYREAQAAFARGAAAGPRVRTAVGLARAWDRLDDPPGACDVWRRAAGLASTERVQTEIRQALARPACGAW